MTDDRPTHPPSRTPRVADVQLRGRAGPLRARAYWPAPASVLTTSGAPPLLVLFPRGTGAGGGAEAETETLGRGLCSLTGVVVLAVGYRPPSPDALGGALEDATTATHWAADHAAELGADPGRLLVAGEGVGADLAATVARHARDDGWPPIARQVLVRARLGAATLAADSLAGLAPATVLAGADGSNGSDGAGDSDDGRRYASLLRRSGVPVHEIAVPSDTDDPLPALASSLCDALTPSPAAPAASGTGPDRDDAA